MNYAISIKGLTKKFGNFTAVDNLSFDIPKGKIFGFLGPNGSGKSTTIRMICGVLSPTLGEGKVLGYDLIKDTEKIKQNIGYMSQKFSLYEDLTVEENLEFYGKIYMLPKKLLEERKQELIIMANLKGKEKSLAGTLSGGWKQRLALGCSLIHNPKLLILDEPTAGVDPVSRREFWHTITELVKDGITVLVTTHYMDEASICDIIGFIYNSKLITIDTPENLYKEHNTENLEEVFINYVKKLSNRQVISSFNDLKASE
ncbi:ABC transporter ATP-binding protein [Clostridium scatologenes]|uniref:ABC transporter related protein n=1 Tax=Clostridium scatologenes TaxID=1548 RepID=A0A0E3MBJ0_CLOSL|nr:ABC transporter ATP-binding protein [Clostridium scatologenes]AKA71788.1 ABC transporter related protein [Clostridium scatologenes]